MVQESCHQTKGTHSGRHQLRAPVAAFSTDELSDTMRLYLGPSQHVLDVGVARINIHHLVQQAECQIAMDPGLELDLDVEVEVQS